MTTPDALWAETYRVEAVRDAEPDWPGFVAFDIILRPLDRIGRVNGRTRHLVTLKVGGPSADVDVAPVRAAIGKKLEFTYRAGPTPTTRAVLRKARRP